MLVDYSWPGNVRELRNFSERALLLSPMETISEEDVRAVLSPSVPLRPASGPARLLQGGARQILDQFDKEFITRPSSETAETSAPPPARSGSNASTCTRS